MEKLSKPTLENSSGAAAAEYTRFAGRSVPAHYGDPEKEYAALREAVAVVDRPQEILRLTGGDPVGMLNAILTNDVPKEGDRGAYALLLNQKGRVQTDLRVLRSGEEVIILAEPEGADSAKEILGRYAPFSRTKLEEADGWSVLGLYGPRAKDLLGVEVGEHESRKVALAGAQLIAFGVKWPASGYDLLGPDDALRTAREHLVAEGATPVGIHAYEAVRVEASIPRFGADITSENFPAEAGVLDRAVSFDKGCYPGQETVARMHYRGHPNRSLHRLKIEDAPPLPDAPILQNEKQVGRITSVAPLPVAGRILALGYLHRNADTNAPLHTGETLVSLIPPA